jgi:Fe-S-cluster containining protein
MRRPTDYTYQRLSGGAHVNEDFIFLTTREAIDAICIDFRQYDPQILLFSEILPLITDNRIHIRREPGKKGAWVSRSGRADMRWLDGPALVGYMCRAVGRTPWHPGLLATVCGRVFQTRAVAACDTATRAEGVCIETNMADYVCRQCGHCCQTLDYHEDVTAEDVALWRSMGREDILQWVGESICHGQTHAYRIWVIPETGQLAETCPFLKRDPTTNRWQCLIHDVKPAICRHYPVSRKHAMATGCRGFEKAPASKP